MPTNNSLRKLLHVHVASDFDVFIHSQIFDSYATEINITTDGYEHAH